MDLVGPLALALGASGGFGWYADPARSGARFTARATFRYRPLNWLTTRLGYSHTLRTASDPVYGSNIDSISAEVEFRAARSTWFSVAAFGERGDQTFCQDILPASEAVTTAATVTAFEPHRAPATTLGVGVGFEQGLGVGFSIDLGATWRRTGTPDGTYSGPSASANVVWRWE